jgi:hypothetical protein
VVFGLISREDEGSSNYRIRLLFEARLFKDGETPKWLTLIGKVYGERNRPYQLQDVKPEDCVFVMPAGNSRAQSEEGEYVYDLQFLSRHSSVHYPPAVIVGGGGACLLKPGSIDVSVAKPGSEPVRNSTGYARRQRQASQ